MRRASRRDASEPAIVAALESAGCTVYRHLPVDLLVIHPAFPHHARLLECKTPQANGRKRSRHDQAEQEAFCETTDTPVVTTPEEALRALGLRM